MRWLTTTAILCMLTMPAIAQDLVQIPTSLYCGPTNPQNDQRIFDEYGELPFLEGDGEIMSPDPRLSYQGDIRMFYDPNDLSYSVFIDLPGDITCLVVTGIKIEPALRGEDI